MAQLYFYDGVIVEFDRRLAGYLIPLVEPIPAEEHSGSGVFNLTACREGTEGELGPSIAADLELGRLQVEVVAISQVRLDDAPPADELTVSPSNHGATGLMFGGR